MSRIGNKTITIPAGVEFSVNGNEVTVKGPKGTLTRQFSPLISIENDNGTLTCVRANEEKHTKQLHGTTRALLNNMIVGVTNGFSKKLIVDGIGYRAAMAGNTLTMNLGYSHEIKYVVEEGVKVECPKANEIVVSGIDKQRVGEVAANIRAFRKPEPYKGKGIHYEDEHIRRKEGKTAGKK
ncbi:MAG: 50S ribosomal protein L6 [Erysipelotrichaceae bacterium]|nr:50S ribosomal protein L6 [Erysipelotrichaceae bacterium]